MASGREGGGGRGGDCGPVASQTTAKFRTRWVKQGTEGLKQRETC